MLISRAPRRPLRRRDDRGQGTLEYVGIVIVTALLVAALAIPGTGALVRAEIACQIQSLGSQAGTCDGNDAPTTYAAADPDGPDGPDDGPGGADGPDDSGVSSTPPSGGPPEQVDPDPEGGDGDTTPSRWDNASEETTDPVDPDVVDGAVDDFQDALEGDWNGVRSGDLDDISGSLQGLSGQELDAVISSLSDEELVQWLDELDDGSVIGSGWSRERRRELWGMIAAKASEATMRRLDEFTDEVQPEFHDVGGDDASADPDSPVHDAEYTEVPHELFVGDSEDPDEPLVDPSDLNQGMIGDCWLIASIGALAQGDPDAVESMIRANGNGAYTITLYDDGEAVSVTVTPDIPTVGGDPLFADNPDDSDAGAETYELWPHLIEKAAAQFYGDYEDLEGDWPSKALELLTGRDVETHNEDWFGIDDPDPPSIDDLDSLLDGGGAVLVSTAHENRTSLYEDGTIVQGHAHYVQQVDPEAGTVTIVNPWGLDDYPPITMSYAHFEDSFIRYDTADLG